MSNTVNLGRRSFLKSGVAAGGGLTLAFCIPLASCSEDDPGQATDEEFRPNVWLQINTDNSVEIYVAEAEMGQGVHTAIPMLVAEELDVAWEQIRMKRAPVTPDYGEQITGGSTSIRKGWKIMRQAGATARLMLLEAAARTWGSDIDKLLTYEGMVVDTAQDKQLSYGELAAVAATLPLPGKVTLKDPKDFRIIGKSIPSIHSTSMTNGSAIFGIDVKLGGLMIATVQRAPFLGGRVVSFKADRTLNIPGVHAAFTISSGVAVIADSYTSAMAGRAALEIEWSENKRRNISSESIWQNLAKGLEGDADRELLNRGDPEAVDTAAMQFIEAEYRAPFQAHATMEPMNCTVRIKDDICEIWVPTQGATRAQRTAEKAFLSPLAKALRKLEKKIRSKPPEVVKVYPTLIGGGFGRRLMQDFVKEAVEIARLSNKPVKLIWSREDDMQHDFYRPATYHRLAAAISSDGELNLWRHRVVGEEKKLVAGGADSLPYDIPNVQVEFARVQTSVPSYFWRSVGNSHNAFVKEAFLDEIAVSLNRDPYEYRLSLLGREPRLKAVLELAASKAGWHAPRADNRFLGIAAHVAYGSYVAQVAEISVGSDGLVRVHRVFCAVDCGMVVNPDTVKAQMEGGIIFGLGAVLKDEITLKEGRIQQSNFLDFRLLRFDEAPRTETYIVSSTEKPGGIGEPGVPPIAAAVVNAVYAATGVRIRSLPIKPPELAASMSAARSGAAT